MADTLAGDHGATNGTHSSCPRWVGPKSWQMIPEDSSSPPAQREPEPALVLRNVSKNFPGVRALDDVSFEVRFGEVHALLGENGAGKSTLIKIVSGVYPPDAGELEINGRAVHFSNPGEAQAEGIATIYQDFSLYPELTVAENIFAGHMPRMLFATV